MTMYSPPFQFTENKAFLSAVVTNPFSDWSLLPFPSSHSDSQLSLDTYTSFKISRAGSFVRVFIKLEGEQGGWTMIREVTNFLKDGEEVWVGVMGASPKGDGVTVEFKDLWIE